MIQFTNPKHVGPYLPHFWNEGDPRSAIEQANTSYVYGGWQPMIGFKLLGTEETTFGLAYSDVLFRRDPVMHEVSRAKLRDEIIVLFPSDWVAIIQPGSNIRERTFEVSRMD